MWSAGTRAGVGAGDPGLSCLTLHTCTLSLLVLLWTLLTSSSAWKRTGKGASGTVSEKEPPHPFLPPWGLRQERFSLSQKQVHGQSGGRGPAQGPGELSEDRAVQGLPTAQP